MTDLNPKKKRYPYISAQNKAEKPINLIPMPNFMIKKGIAKRLVWAELQTTWSVEPKIDTTMFRNYVFHR